MRSLTMCTLLLVLLAGSWTASAQAVDTVTTASVTNYYGPAADFSYLAQVTFNGVVVVSTTNPDGSPNAAVLIPSLFEDRYLIMRLAPNQTAINLAADGRAMVTIFTPAGQETQVPNRAEVRRYGARLTCIALFSGEEYDSVRARWNEAVANEAYKLEDGEPILRIEAVQPIG